MRRKKEKEMRSKEKQTMEEEQSAKRNGGA
jgi:hypothetical protein